MGQSKREMVPFTAVRVQVFQLASSSSIYLNMLNFEF